MFADITAQMDCGMRMKVASLKHAAVVELVVLWSERPVWLFTEMIAPHHVSCFLPNVGLDFRSLREEENRFRGYPGGISSFLKPLILKS